MLTTFIIGLREGLEAALIVGIVAAFLRKNGRRLFPMWLGVAAAVVLSVAVGVGLKVVESSLPQAAQEGMETVIGAVAVVFVTGMILWMSRHSRGLKKELESSAQAALGDGTSTALVLMAFLAVLKEGFETAVFLLATFSAATNATAAATGAALGVLVAIGLGIGIYRGGVRINLSKFFRGTGVFLVLVAAGLVVSALRTAHEAGWLNAGQQRTLDLDWLAPVGSVRGALFTGVLGIPSDPRLVEVLGWLCYIVPLGLIVLWPPTKRPGALASIGIKQAIAAVAVVTAALLTVLVSAPTLAATGPAPLVDSTGSEVGTVRLSDPSHLVATLRTTAAAAAATTTTTTTVALTDKGAETHAGTAAEHLTGAVAVDGPDLPTTVTLGDLVALDGGRIPVGIDAGRNPGPFTAAWTRTGTVDTWLVDGTLLDVRAHNSLVLTLSGGGLPTPRTLSVSAGATLPGAAGTAPASWTVDTAYVERVVHSALTLGNSRAEARFWGRIVPALLVLAAVALLLAARRARRALEPRATTRDDRTTTTPRRNVHAG